MHELNVLSYGVAIYMGQRGGRVGEGRSGAPALACKILRFVAFVDWLLTVWDGGWMGVGVECSGECWCDLDGLYPMNTSFIEYGDCRPRTRR